MEKSEYEAALTRMSKTIEVKSELKADILKNQIADSLLSEYRSLEKIESLDMTPEVGKVVFSQLKRVFLKLEKAGITWD